jgi:hypothetical protein
MVRWHDVLAEKLCAYVWIEAACAGVDATTLAPQERFAPAPSRSCLALAGSLESRGHQEPAHPGQTQAHVYVFLLTTMTLMCSHFSWERGHLALVDATKCAFSLRKHHNKSSRPMMRRKAPIVV